VAWGFAEVLPDKVTILAETAERAEDIDVNRARTAKQRAEEELRKAGPTGNPEAEAALQRANARLDVAEK
jgi:F-type H+-transporting ATPase subunit epsilon